MEGIDNAVELKLTVDISFFLLDVRRFVDSCGSGHLDDFTESGYHKGMECRLAREKKTTRGG